MNDKPILWPMSAGPSVGETRLKVRHSSWLGAFFCKDIRRVPVVSRARATEALLGHIRQVNHDIRETQDRRIQNVLLFFILSCLTPAMFQLIDQHVRTIVK